MITGYDPSSRTLTTGIGDLIDFGRLPDSLAPSENPLRLRTRQQLHSRFQRELIDSGYRREVEVSGEWRTGGVLFCIRGRVDLLKENGGLTELLEVKTLCGEPDFEDPVVFRTSDVLQLYFYSIALAAGREGQASGMSASLVYLVPTDSGFSVRSFPLDLGDGRIVDSWSELLKSTATSLLEEDGRKRAQAEALKSFSFPFEVMRPGQGTMLKGSAECVSSSGRLLLQAPTGTGKTAAILTGALTQALSARLTLFFLTAKNTQKLMAERTLGLIASRGIPLRTVFLSSRASVCHMRRERCVPQECPYAVDFGARVRSSGVMDSLLRTGLVTRTELAEKTREAGVCAFELALCLSERSDVVVCDCNYVFDPHVFLRRFFEDRRSSSRCALLIDEAANLPSRAVDYYSPEIRESWITELNEASPPGTAMRRLLAPWRGCFRECRGLLHGRREKETELPRDTHLPCGADGWAGLLNDTHDPSGTLLDMVRSVVDFSRVPADDRYHLLFRREGKDHVLQWLCTDPSDYLRERLESCHSAVAFSATLTPFDHFRYSLGFPRETTGFMRVGYPFPAENLGVWIWPDIDTRYRHRHTSETVLACRILRLRSASPGTWIVFFPSFEYMGRISRLLENMGARTLVQKPGMSSDERLDFIRRLEEDGRLVLTVSGGVFSEGIDICCATLAGAVVVGPSLPGMSLRRRLLAESYARRGMDGFLHAWAIPGMIRVVQAAGRLVRDTGQRRALILAGRRFTMRPYLGLMPEHWFSKGSIRLLRDDQTEIALFLDERESFPPAGQQCRASPM